MSKNNVTENCNFHECSTRFHFGTQSPPIDAMSKHISTSNHSIWYYGHVISIKYPVIYTKSKIYVKYSMMQHTAYKLSQAIILIFYIHCVTESCYIVLLIGLCSEYILKTTFVVCLVICWLTRKVVNVCRPCRLLPRPSQQSAGQFTTRIKRLASRLISSWHV